MFGIDDIIIGMAISGALAGGSSLAGGLMANQGAEDQANAANKWGVWMQQGQQAFAREQTARAEQQAATAREWMERLSNSSYQRGMADMRLAGLNPILAYSQGGATSPATSAPGAMSAGSSGPGAMAPVKDVIGPAVSSAMQSARTIQGIQSAQASIDQTRANTTLLAEETKLRQDQQAQTRAHTALAAAQTAESGERTGLLTRQQATEAMNPALRAAQTAAAGASAAEAGERTVGHRQENERFRNWGPRSSAADAGANIEAAGRRAAATGASPEFRGALDSIGRALGGQSGYSGPRSIPSGPPSNSRWVDDPYGLR